MGGVLFAFQGRLGRFLFIFAKVEKGMAIEQSSTRVALLEAMKKRTNMKLAL